MASRAEHVKQLMEMGFPENRARKALIMTHDCGTEPALHWLIENADSPDIDAPVPESLASRSSGRVEGSSSGFVGDTVPGQPPALGVPTQPAVSVINPDGACSPGFIVGTSECKAVLVVDTSLKMSIGKTAAQCAHAAVGLVKNMHANSVPWLHAWEMEGEKTVVLKANSSAELEALEAKAQSLLLPTFMVEDAGRTEIAAGSKTVLGIAGVSEVVDQVTGRLSTLR
ncbi:g3551 [Coccomyxa elongata]